ncbi:hypothetical protein V5O48_008250 [Marasmius crinis-equi]|uniref:Uncharacterized protein n=1 Tax=Marasmius crinis-equi TaxID=585013 RepID=A0ABR3FEX2_9AGAR
MSETSTTSKKPEETETVPKVEGIVDVAEEKVDAEPVKEKDESEGAVRSESKGENEDAEEGVDEDDEEPQPPGFKGRGMMSYNSSGTQKPTTTGRPGRPGY